MGLLLVHAANDEEQPPNDVQKVGYGVGVQLVEGIDAVCPYGRTAVKICCVCGCDAGKITRRRRRIREWGDGAFIEEVLAHLVTQTVREMMDGRGRSRDECTQLAFSSTVSYGRLSQLSAKSIA